MFSVLADVPDYTFLNHMKASESSSFSVVSLFFSPYKTESYFNMAEKNRAFLNNHRVHLHPLFRL